MLKYLFTNFLDLLPSAGQVEHLESDIFHNLDPVGLLNHFDILDLLDPLKLFVYMFCQI